MYPAELEINDITENIISTSGAAVAEWLSSWLAEQEDRGSIPGLATWIFRDWLSPASKSRHGWKIAKSTLIFKTTNQPTTSTSYLDLLLSIGRDGQLNISIYDKRDDLNFYISNFPLLSSNIISPYAYNVFISQFIR